MSKRPYRTAAFATAVCICAIGVPTLQAQTMSQANSSQSSSSTPASASTSTSAAAEDDLPSLSSLTDDNSSSSSASSSDSMDPDHFGTLDNWSVNTAKLAEGTMANALSCVGIYDVAIAKATGDEILKSLHDGRDDSARLYEGLAAKLPSQAQDDYTASDKNALDKVAAGTLVLDDEVKACDSLNEEFGGWG